MWGVIKSAISAMRKFFLIGYYREEREEARGVFDNAIAFEGLDLVRAEHRVSESEWIFYCRLDSGLYAVLALDSRQEVYCYLTRRSDFLAIVPLDRLLGRFEKGLVVGRSKEYVQRTLRDCRDLIDARLAAMAKPYGTQDPAD